MSSTTKIKSSQKKGAAIPDTLQLMSDILGMKLTKVGQKISGSKQVPYNILGIDVFLKMEILSSSMLFYEGDLTACTVGINGEGLSITVIVDSRYDLVEVWVCNKPYVFPNVWTRKGLIEFMEDHALRMFRNNKDLDGFYEVVDFKKKCKEYSKLRSAGTPSSSALLKAFG